MGGQIDAVTVCPADKPVWHPWVRLLDWSNRHGKALAVRLCGGIHPKHLIPDGDAHEWYLAPLRPDWAVLDVGCGTGRHTLRVQERCRLAMGIDRDPSIWSRSPHLRVWDFARRGLPYPSATFDAALCLDVIEHMDDRPALLAEIRRVLKPGGLLFISAPNRETTWRRRLRAAGLPSFSDPDHRVEYTRHEFVGELYAAGFALADAIRPTTLDTPWAGLQDALGACWLPLYAWLHQRRRAVGQDTAESTGFQAVAAKVDKR